MIAAECLARDGQPEQALAALRAELGRQDLDDPGAPVLRAGLGTILFWCDELPAAAGHLAAAEAAQDASPVPFQARRQFLAASVRRVLADYRIGAWDEAADRAERLVTLAADLDQDSLLCGAHAAAVYPAAARGRWDTARAHAGAAARYAAAGDRDQLLDVAGARVTLAFAMDDPEAVLAAARPVVVELAGLAGVADGADGLAGLADLAGFAGAEPALLSFWPLYAHALARVGRLAEAADALAPFAELASASGRRSAIAAAARVEGFIHAAAGRPDAARRAYQVALASLDGLCMPHEEALTRLDYGRFLRHQSQRRAALRELYAARAAFARLGAIPFLARCDAELGHEVPTVPMVPSVPAEPAATSAANAQLSASAVRAAPTWPAPLTARQLAVAEAVAEGKSNRQVARELYITVKTVEYHVSQIFAKLGAFRAGLEGPADGDGLAVHADRHDGQSARPGGRGGRAGGHGGGGGLRRRQRYGGQGRGCRDRCHDGDPAPPGKSSVPGEHVGDPFRCARPCGHRRTGARPVRYRPVAFRPPPRTYGPLRYTLALSAPAAPQGRPLVRVPRVRAPYRGGGSRQTLGGVPAVAACGGV